VQVIPGIETAVSNSDSGVGYVIAYILFTLIIVAGIYFFVRKRMKKL